MVKGVDRAGHVPSGGASGGRPVKPSKDLRESVRDTNDVLDGRAENIQGRMSRRDLLASSGQLVRAGAGKLKVAITDPVGPVKATNRIFQRNIGNFTAHQAYLED